MRQEKKKISQARAKEMTQLEFIFFFCGFPFQLESSREFRARHRLVVRFGDVQFAFFRRLVLRPRVAVLKTTRERKKKSDKEANSGFAEPRNKI